MSVVEKVISDSIHIRVAQKEDLSKIDELITLKRMELPRLLRISLWALFKVCKGVSEKRLEDPKSKFLIAEDSEGIIGFLNGCILSDRNTGWVQSFYVAPERRGGVVAKRLLSEFEALLKSQSIEDIEAQVLKDGRPHRLAKLRGWVDIQEIAKHEVHIWKSL